MKVPGLGADRQFTLFGKEVVDSFTEILKTGRFILGEKGKMLEKKIASICAADSAVGVASGTDALLLSLMACDVGPGDEVITTPFTFFATIGSISRLGAIPVFVDIELDTYNIDTALIEKKITNKTKAILPVHLFGQCADMTPIMDLAKKHELYVIEDAAQSIGAKYQGKMAGSIGDFGCFSFYPTKNLGGAGDGGMVTANDGDLAEKVRCLRVHGSKVKYYHELVGINSRLDELQAAILLIKLNYLEDWTQRRRTIAQKYSESLTNLPITLPIEQSGNFSVWNQYTIRTDKRDALREFLKEQQIATEIYYPVPMHLQNCFKDLGYKEGSMPCSEQASKEVLSLPIFPELTNQEQNYVIEKLHLFFTGKTE